MRTRLNGCEINEVPVSDGHGTVLAMRCDALIRSSMSSYPVSLSGADVLRGVAGWTSADHPRHI
jgi:hypothetical protein